MSVAVPADPSIRIRELKRAEYDRLVDAGVFDGEPVELIGGVLVEMSPQGSRHAWVVTRLSRRLTLALHDRYDIREEKPLAIDDVSEPEPDIAVVEPTGPDAHPTTAIAVVEVARSSHALDLGEKALRYARAGVGTYWVIDLPGRRVHVHTQPGPEGYGSITTADPGGELDLVGVPVDLGELLPPT